MSSTSCFDGWLAKARFLLVLPKGMMRSTEPVSRTVGESANGAQRLLPAREYKLLPPVLCGGGETAGASRFPRPRYPPAGHKNCRGMRPSSSVSSPPQPLNRSSILYRKKNSPRTTHKPPGAARVR